MQSGDDPTQRRSSLILQVGKAQMHRSLVKAIIVLPGTVLVLVPALIALASIGRGLPIDLSPPNQSRFWIALLTAAAGFFLSGWSAALFMKFGRGTPAPWEPPQQLVIRGPYRHVRNPMITGVLLILLAEALLLGSWSIAAWMLAFFVGNAIYFPLVEEKGLERRFGRQYLVYKSRVPRWVPRLRPWKPSDGS
jgi:protein-S-isoprenylcysteine O-methyltransferase Ste14